MIFTVIGKKAVYQINAASYSAAVEALVAAAPHQLLWGSDWPFVRMAAQPDPAALLDQLLAWLGPKAFAQCMTENPARLFAATKSLDGPTAPATS